jgi:uncharacterized protein (DUF885 family)
VSALSERIDAFLAEFFALHPLSATTAGMHVHDGEWPDPTNEGLARQLAFYDRWTDELVTFGNDALSEDERIDRDLLLGELAAHRFSSGELREETWSPLEWVYLFGDGLFSLIAREFAPLADRLGSVTSRLEGIPHMLDVARDLIGSGDRPVSRLHTEKAIERWEGIAELVDDAMALGEQAADGGDSDVAAVLPGLRAAADAARPALAAFETHHREVVLPASEREGRLGPELFAAKMVHTVFSTELTPDRIKARAEQEFGAVRAEMIRIALGTNYRIHEQSTGSTRIEPHTFNGDRQKALVRYFIAAGGKQNLQTRIEQNRMDLIAAGFGTHRVRQHGVSQGFGSAAAELIDSLEVRPIFQPARPHLLIESRHFDLDVTPCPGSIDVGCDIGSRNSPRLQNSARMQTPGVIFETVNFKPPLARVLGLEDNLNRW